jgi:trimeric autotransporter adhesin
VCDFNGDSKLDLAVAGIANFPDHQVSIFTGNGDGTFAAGFDINDASAQSLAAADFTGNGSSDLSTFGSVLLGNLTISTVTDTLDLPVGFVVIQADYPGDASNAPSNSTNTPGILVPQPLFSLSSNPVTVAPGTSASGSFSVTSSGFTGTLSLSCFVPGPNDETPSPLTCSVPPTVNFISASTTMNLTYTITAQSITPAGQYSAVIMAIYAPGGPPPASTSAEVSVVAQSYTLSNTGATIASPGASGSSTITVSPNGGFTGQVSMTCAVAGGPSGAVNSPTCTIPSPISVTGSPVTTTLTLNTQPATTPGSYTVTVTGASVGGLNATTSFPVNVPANVPAAHPGFTLSSTALTIASPGSNGTSTITITPTGGFTGSVALSCAVSGGPTGAADAPTCSVTAPPAITGGTSVTATLTLSTIAASAAAYSQPAAPAQHPPRGVAIGGSVVAIASLLWFGFPIRRRRTITKLGLLLMATLIGAAIGCGGGNSAAPPANPGTTPGAYTVTVMGSSGAITATAAVTVTVN